SSSRTMPPAGNKRYRENGPGLHEAVTSCWLARHVRTSAGPSASNDLGRGTVDHAAHCDQDPAGARDRPESTPSAAGTHVARRPGLAGIGSPDVVWGGDGGEFARRHRG